MFLYVIEAKSDDFEDDVDEDFLPIVVWFFVHSCVGFKKFLFLFMALKKYF